MTLVASVCKLRSWKERKISSNTAAGVYPLVYQLTYRIVSAVRMFPFSSLVESMIVSYLVSLGKLDSIQSLWLMNCKGKGSILVNQYILVVEGIFLPKGFDAVSVYQANIFGHPGSTILALQWSISHCKESWIFCSTKLKMLFRSKTAIQTELVMQWLEFEFSQFNFCHITQIQNTNNLSNVITFAEKWQQCSAMNINIANLRPNWQLKANIAGKVTFRTKIAKLDRGQNFLACGICLCCRLSSS